MTSTPPENNASITDSWVDLSGQFSQGGTPTRLTPIPFGGEPDYLRMLREAQTEILSRSSCRVSPLSSAIMSLNSTTKNTPSASPKSPPNSPNPELATFSEDLKGVYINKTAEASANVTNFNSAQPAAVTPSDIYWDWSAKPTSHQIGRDWQLSSTRSRKSSSGASIAFNKLCSNSNSSSASENSNEGGKKFYSKGVIYTLILTNLISVILGVGIGFWVSKRGSGGSGVIDIPVQ